MTELCEIPHPDSDGQKKMILIFIKHYSYQLKFDLTSVF